MAHAPQLEQETLRGATLGSRKVSRRVRRASSRAWRLSLETLTDAPETTCR